MNRAKLFKWMFRFKFTRKYYFGLYSNIFKPKRLFKGLTTTCIYDSNLKMIVDLDDWIQQQIYFFESYDPVHIDFIKKQLKSGDYFFDIGANIGCFTLTASKCVGDGGKVFAFEPVEKVYKRLNENIALNELKNVCVFNTAIYDKYTLLKLNLSNQDNLGMSSVQEHDAMSGEVIDVQADSLDNFINSNKINKVDFIKIDIEGSELYALRGMVNTISKYKPICLVEVSEGILTKESDRNQIFQFFEKSDYNAFIITNEGLLKPKDIQDSKFYTNYVFKPAA